MAQANEIIESFLKHYERECDFYYNLAQLTAEQCEKMLVEHGIRAMVTFRAKKIKKLKEKIYKRHKTKKYCNKQSIREDIVDLSGVRIALYFPADRTLVKNFLLKNFITPHDKIRIFPESEINKEGKESKSKFDGYHAEHYRVSLKPETLKDTKYTNHIVEIQVASILMHAWAEVNHDLAYKPSSGKLSRQEVSILDTLNGLILTGENMLEQLQATSQERVSRAGRKFQNQYELADFLCKKLNKLDGDIENIEVREGRVSVLFSLLQEISCDTPNKISRFLVNLEGDNRKRTVVEQIVDNIIYGRLDWLKIYSKFQHKNTKENLKLTSESIKFLESWNLFQRYIRCFAKLNNVQESAMYKTLRLLSLSPDLLSNIDFLGQVRNTLVHQGVDAINISNRLNDMVQNILSELSSLDNPASKKAMEWARSGQLELPKK